MDIFYIIVCIIAIVILLLTFIAIGYVMTKPPNTNVKFPTLANNCPDFWESTGSGLCIVPTTTKNNIGTFTADKVDKSPLTFGYDYSNNLIDFSDLGWASGSVSKICYQSQWANSYQIAWDGVSNYVGCNSSSDLPM
jgi:hypothetical protein